MAESPVSLLPQESEGLLVNHGSGAQHPHLRDMYAAGTVLTDSLTSGPSEKANYSSRFLDSSGLGVFIGSLLPALYAIPTVLRHS